MIFPCSPDPWNCNNPTIHMHADYLGLIERGLNIPSLNTGIRLAEAFDVPAATLLEPIEAYRKALGLDVSRRRR